MCLLLLAFRADPDFPLIVAANRDEFHARPTAAADWRDGVLAGQDLQAGGTWMGVNRRGRFVAVTNYRDPADTRAAARSRGLLVSETLRSEADDETLFESLQREAGGYNGFNLVFGSPDCLYTIGNRGPSRRVGEPGLYGLSNHLFESPWPKVERGKRGLADYLRSGRAPDPEPLFELLSDRHLPEDRDLPDTGVGLPMERLLAPIFIQSPSYGTRASTVLIHSRSGAVTFAERGYAADGAATDTRRFRFQAGG